MKKGIWIVLPLLLVGVSACSGGSATTATAVATTTPGTVEASGNGLEGVEFIVHQVPG